MTDAAGETNKLPQVAFDRRVNLEFYGTRITSDAGLLAYRELDEVLGLTATAASVLAEGRREKNIRHRLIGCCAKRSMVGSQGMRT
jgi:Transposase DDE domain group 1